MNEEQLRAHFEWVQNVFEPMIAELRGAETKPPVAPPKSKSAGSGRGFADETVQSRPGLAPRDRPLPEGKQRRHRVPGGPDYAYPRR